MFTANEMHIKAMDSSALGFMEQERGNTGQAERYFKQALAEELAAIDKLADFTEPTFSILHRSAATLALDCKESRLAEQLVAKALAREPHPEIAEELRDLFEQIQFQRHLALKGVELEDQELQMSLTGTDVGQGMISADELLDRIADFSRLVYRTAERKAGMEFRESGRAVKEVWNTYQPYVSAPRTGSFALTFRLGRPSGQQSLTLEAIDLVDECLATLEMANESRLSEIQNRIPDPAYQRNLLALARKIAPDGRRIRQVGFTVIRSGKEHQVSISEPASNMPKPSIPGDTTTIAESMELRGALLFADGTKSAKNTIKIIDETSKKHTLLVPEGMMNDIVRPLWNKEVDVIAFRKGRIIELQEITASD